MAKSVDLRAKERARCEFFPLENLESAVTSFELSFPGDGALMRGAYGEERSRLLGGVWSDQWIRSPRRRGSFGLRSRRAQESVRFVRAAEERTQVHQSTQGFREGLSAVRVSESRILS